MGKKGRLRARLAMFYDRHNPGKISDIRDLAKLFVDHESELNDKLRGAYGEDLTDMQVIDDPFLATPPDPDELREALTNFYKTHAPGKAVAPEFDSVVQYYSVLPLFCLNRDLMKEYDDTVTIGRPAPKQSLLRRTSSRFSVARRSLSMRSIKRDSVKNDRRDSAELMETPVAPEPSPPPEFEPPPPPPPPSGGRVAAQERDHPPLPATPAEEEEEEQAPVERKASFAEKVQQTEQRRTDSQRRKFMEDRMKSIKMKRSQLELLKTKSGNNLKLGGLSTVPTMAEEEEDDDDEEEEPMPPPVQAPTDEDPHLQYTPRLEAAVRRAEAELEQEHKGVRDMVDVGGPVPADAPTVVPQLS